MQKLEGTGGLRAHGGHVHREDARSWEILHVDTGCLAAMTDSVQMDVVRRRIKTMLFGGEGVFFVNLTGPGRCGCRACRSRGWRVGCCRRRPDRRFQRGGLDPRWRRPDHARGLNWRSGAVRAATPILLLRRGRQGPARALRLGLHDPIELAPHVRRGRAPLGVREEAGGFLLARPPPRARPSPPNRTRSRGR